MTFPWRLCIAMDHSFWWPEKQDLCWVPFQHRVCAISAPSLLNTRGSMKCLPNQKIR